MSGVVTRRARPAGPRAIGLVCAVAAAGALLSGCGSEKAPQKDAGPPRAVPASAPASPSSSLNSDQAQRKALIPKAKVGYQQALKAAVAAVPSSKPIAAELKGTPASPYWSTAVASSDGTVHDGRVDAITGKLTQSRTESDDSGDKKHLAGQLSKAKVTAQQAAETATEKTKGTVTTIELGNAENGSDAVAWTVGVVTPADWNQTTYGIDATNRKVLWTHTNND